MNIRDKTFFESLHKDRSENANFLEKPALRGFKNSVVEKYSDQAHFIYELLQNADDVHAVNARFTLEHNQLIFAHDGSRHFSITDPANEANDTASGSLGDINAITSIANSNKKESSIGKFGVGFKAVFQYTNTPHIYDPNFRFKIERFFVPSLLEEDFPERKPDETLFIFPFDHHDRGPEEAYDDISNKLKSLTFPLLFLSELQNIEYKIGGLEGFYGKNEVKKYHFNQTTAEKLKLTHFDGIDYHDDDLWLFSRLEENGIKYSVGFFMDSDGNLKPVNEAAFCFFPTKETTGLKFIIHAPFLLTDSREGIQAGKQHNDRMIELLANLSAEAIVLLKEIGKRESKIYIDDNIVNIIPYDPTVFSPSTNKNRISFYPFYTAIFEAFRTFEILPSAEGYTQQNNAYWAAVPQLPQLFSNQQLEQISENEKAKWVFPSIGRENLQKNNKYLTNYIDLLVRTSISEENVINGRKQAEIYNPSLGFKQSVEYFKGITAEFIESQNIEWLHRFYKWLSETDRRTKLAKDKPVFLDQNCVAVPKMMF